MLINMYKQQKIILLKRIMTGILVACLMIINNNADKAYAENNYNESEQVVNVGITTDKSLYSANDDMSVTVTLTNYDNQFYGDITTMIVQLDYDESVITPYADTVKNVADKNSSMGFSHVDVSKSGSITYQYIDVGEALHKNSPVLFSLKFKVNDSIASSDLIKGLIKAARIVMQDGSKQESVRYATSVDYIVDKSADSVANDDTIGLKEYDSLGELLSDDEQKDIQKNAVESKQAEEKNAQKVANNKSNNNDTKNNADISESNNSDSTDINNNNVFEIASSNDNVNSSSSFILPVVIAVIVVIVAGSLCYLCYKKKNTGTHNEEK